MRGILSSSAKHALAYTEEDVRVTGSIAGDDDAMNLRQIAIGIYSGSYSIQ